MNRSNAAGPRPCQARYRTAIEDWLSPLPFAPSTLCGSAWQWWGSRCRCKYQGTRRYRLARTESRRPSVAAGLPHFEVKRLDDKPDDPFDGVGGRAIDLTGLGLEVGAGQLK